jgi:membrane protein YqaA with SNARE-associated domain
MSESADQSVLDAGRGAGDAVEADVAALRVASRRRGWFRLEYATLAALAALFATYALAYFALGVDFDRLKDWGYLGIFLIAMAGAATLVLPTPSNVAIFGSSALLDPVLGIPAPLLVGLIAGLGDAIGEFSGYGLGYAGTDMVRRQRLYRVFERWMQRRGRVTIFLLATFPNPFFDLAGAAAGAARMPARHSFIATLGGKIVKDLFLAYGGSFSIGLLSGAV